MPSNGNIAAHVTVGNSMRLPEYQKEEGKCFIESDLFTPFSYQQEVREMVFGEEEVQSWPVTPYQIEAYLHTSQETSFVQLIIDDVSIDSRIMDGGSTWVVEGFRSSEGTREFLFALPRFARDENDRVSANRLGGIGMIKLRQYSAIATGQRYTTPSTVTETEFEQVNKKDAVRVTGGDYTLSTTKKGKMIEKTSPRKEFHSRLVTNYRRDQFISEIAIQYMMGYSLIEKGFKLKTAPWKTSGGATASPPSTIKVDS